MVIKSKKKLVEKGKDSEERIVFGFFFSKIKSNQGKRPHSLVGVSYYTPMGGGSKKRKKKNRII